MSRVEVIEALSFGNGLRIYGAASGWLKARRLLFRGDEVGARLAELDIDAVVINHPKEIYYFPGIIILEDYGLGDRDSGAAWL